MAGRAGAGQPGAEQAGAAPCAPPSGACGRLPRYAELHAHSAYSFLEGASEPEELVAQASRLGLEALALTDRDGLPGVVRLASAAREVGLATVFGTELTCQDSSHLPLLARGVEGYRALSTLVSRHNLEAGRRTSHPYTLDELAQGLGGSCVALTGTANGPLRRALGAADKPHQWDVESARRCLDEMRQTLGADNVAVEITLSGGPTDAALTGVLSMLARQAHLPLVATGAVRCARRCDRPVADVLAATRLGGSLEEVAGYLPATGGWLRGPREMARVHRRAPHALEAAARLAGELAFDLSLLAPPLPEPEVPEGHTCATWLTELTRQGALERYGTREQDPQAWAVLDHELEVIHSLGFAGYFLIVRTIVDFCQREGILCQGRGSAANSAVCYALGITAVDAVRHRMLFERFLSPGRSGYPDIDLDIEACRREEVIQFVYARYGREHAAQVANVITYRPRSAVRETAKALGYPAGLQDAWAREHQEAPQQVRQLAQRLQGLPRHLGVHSGGMVLTATPLTQVCPVRWAATPGRSVLQWDKEDCAAAGLVKFDLLGLGMLTALRLAFTSLEQRGERVPDLEEATGTLRAAQVGRPWGLHTLPEEDPAVYRLLQAADTVGVFQVESRAQMATLPRLAPRTFYDIVVEVALIRPGPIQGDAVNPYIRRRLGREPVTYLHPLLEPALAKTLGVPLFQEQLMQIAVDAAGFTPAQADRLRQAMGAKRSAQRMEALHAEALEGMAARGIDPATAEAIFERLRAFADFGFPESHAFSFAYLVYASAWLKARRPEDFYAGVLAAQPMGFWSPMTLVRDAQRHGVRVLAADVNASQPTACVQPVRSATMSDREVSLAVLDEEADSTHGQATPADPWAQMPAGPVRVDTHPDLAVRLGLASLKGIGQETAARITGERVSHGPYTSLSDLARRVRLSRSQLETLAGAGATESLGVGRREGVWAAGVLAGEYGRPVAGRSWYQQPLPSTAVGARSPQLVETDHDERVRLDLELTGTSVEGHPLASLRGVLSQDGVVTVASLGAVGHGQRVRVAGLVTHRQRPHTAGGTVFLNLEDESGLLNVICPAGMWRHYRRVGRGAAAVVVRGTVESADGVVALLAERLDPLPGVRGTRSRDWA